jgi:hypothetical protein
MYILHIIKKINIYYFYRENFILQPNLKENYILLSTAYKTLTSCYESLSNNTFDLTIENEK